MTVKELETRTGINRANIRFYEKEGLIAPRRMANGYRDYSEADALALEKIALLRKLGLSIEEIHRIQSGELPLGVALELQDEVLGRQAEEAFHARRICEAIRNDGASYETLEPEKYKGRLPAPAVTNGAALPEHDIESANGHPFRRFLARSLDQMLCVCIAMVIAAFGLRISVQDEVYRFYSGAATFVLMLLLEPLLLCTWGYTPGKWLMGLKLRTWHPEYEKKPGFFEALWRHVQIWIYGYGLEIPGVSLVCAYKCWKRCQNNEDQPWDESDFHYTMASRRFDWGFLVPVAMALTLAATVFAVQDSTRPVNRTTDLTLEQYVENVNDVMEYTFDKAERLQTDGAWYTPQTPGVMNLDNYIWGDPAVFDQQIQVENGLVTAVTMTYPLQVKAGESVVTSDGQFKKAATAMALLGGDRAVDLDSLVDRLVVLLSRGEGELTEGDWVIRQTIADKPENFGECFHYADGMWICIGEKSQSLTTQPVITFTIEKVQ